MKVSITKGPHLDLESGRIVIEAVDLADDYHFLINADAIATSDLADLLGLRPSDWRAYQQHTARLVAARAAQLAQLA